MTHVIRIRRRSQRERPSAGIPVELYGPSGDAEYDALLAEALTVARETLGEDHPLVAKVLRELKSKERKRTRVLGNGADSLTAQVCRGNQRFLREGEVAHVLTQLLEEEPIREAHLPGFGERRVDMLFARHRLVVEENGTRHYYENGIAERDATLRHLCPELGLRLLVVEEKEPLTSEHLNGRLRDLGVS